MRYIYTKACSQYGASMGRRDNITEALAVEKLHLQRVRLDSGGYDPGGAYWGHGAPLFVAWGDGTEEVQSGKRCLPLARHSVLTSPNCIFARGEIMKRELRAWTGGTRPDKRRNVLNEEKALIHILFRTNISVHVRYWQGLFDGLHSARVIYNRARYDAHATMR